MVYAINCPQLPQILEANVMKLLVLRVGFHSSFQTSLKTQLYKINIINRESAEANNLVMDKTLGHKHLQVYQK